MACGADDRIERSLDDAFRSHILQLPVYDEVRSPPYARLKPAFSCRNFSLSSVPDAASLARSARCRPLTRDF